MSDKRRLQLTRAFRLSVEENRLLIGAAEIAGVGPSTFSRQAVLRAAGLPPGPVRKRRSQVAIVIAQHLGVLGRIGSLLNQMARHSNQGGRVDAEALNSLRLEVEKLAQVLLDIGEEA